MKIISIVTSFPRNEKDVLIPWIIRLIQLLKDRGVESEIFTSSYCGMKGEVQNGMKVWRFRYFFKRWEKLSHDMSVPEKLKSDKRYFFVLPFFMFFGFISAFRFAKKNDFDLIHVHFPFPLAIFGIAMKIASKKPMIITCHGSEVNMAKRNKVFRAIFKWMIKYADVITVNSSFMEKEVLKIVGDREIIKIPMGSGLPEDVDKNIQKNEKSNDKKNVLFVGRLIEWKGVKYLIEAAKMLDPQKFEIHIVGDGPERARLEEMAGVNSEIVNSEQKKSTPQSFGQLPLTGEQKTKSLALSRERDLGKGFHHSPFTTHYFPLPIHFHGYLTGDALEKMYKNADVFVLPSIVDDQGFTEGLGTVLLEAISYGMPVIGSNVGGIPDIIINGKTGILVPQKDADAIAQAIKRILDDPNLAEELKKNAKEHIFENFSWEMITNKFFKIYENL